MDSFAQGPAGGSCEHGNEHRENYCVVQEISAFRERLSCIWLAGLTASKSIWLLTVTKSDHVVSSRAIIEMSSQRKSFHDAKNSVMTKTTDRNRCLLAPPPPTHSARNMNVVTKIRMRLMECLSKNTENVQWKRQRWTHTHLHIAAKKLVKTGLGCFVPR